MKLNVAKPIALLILEITLIYDANKHQAYETVRFVRSFFIEWSTSKRGVVKRT
jgi:hypothetical protein